MENPLLDLWYQYHELFIDNYSLSDIALGLSEFILTDSRDTVPDLEDHTVSLNPLLLEEVEDVLDSFQDLLDGVGLLRSMQQCFIIDPERAALSIFRCASGFEAIESAWDTFSRRVYMAHHWFRLHCFHVAEKDLIWREVQHLQVQRDSRVNVRGNNVPTDCLGASSHRHASPAMDCLAAKAPELEVGSASHRESLSLLSPSTSSLTSSDRYTQDTHASYTAFDSSYTDSESYVNSSITNTNALQLPLSAFHASDHLGISGLQPSSGNTSITDGDSYGEFEVKSSSAGMLDEGERNSSSNSLGLPYSLESRQSTVQSLSEISINVSPPSPSPSMFLPSFLGRRRPDADVLAIDPYLGSSYTITNEPRSSFPTIHAFDHLVALGFLDEIEGSGKEMNLLSSLILLDRISRIPDASLQDEPRQCSSNGSEERDLMSGSERGHTDELESAGIHDGGDGNQVSKARLRGRLLDVEDALNPTEFETPRSNLLLPPLLDPGPSVFVVASIQSHCCNTNEDSASPRLSPTISSSIKSLYDRASTLHSRATNSASSSPGAQDLEAPESSEPFSFSISDFDVKLSWSWHRGIDSRESGEKASKIGFSIEGDMVSVGRLSFATLHRSPPLQLGPRIPRPPSLDPGPSCQVLTSLSLIDVTARFSFDEEGSKGDSPITVDSQHILVALEKQSRLESPSSTLGSSQRAGRHSRINLLAPARGSAVLDTNDPVVYGTGSSIVVRHCLRRDWSYKQLEFSADILPDSSLSSPSTSSRSSRYSSQSTPDFDALMLRLSSSISRTSNLLNLFDSPLFESSLPPLLDPGPSRQILPSPSLLEVLEIETVPTKSLSIAFLRNSTAARPSSSNRASRSSELECHLTLSLTNDSKTELESKMARAIESGVSREGNLVSMRSYCGSRSVNEDCETLRISRTAKTHSAKSLFGDSQPTLLDPVPAREAPPLLVLIGASTRSPSNKDPFREDSPTNGKGKYALVRGDDKLSLRYSPSPAPCLALLWSLQRAGQHSRSNLLAPARGHAVPDTDKPVWYGTKYLATRSIWTTLSVLRQRQKSTLLTYCRPISPLLITEPNYVDIPATTTMMSNPLPGVLLRMSMPDLPRVILRGPNVPMDCRGTSSRGHAQPAKDCLAGKAPGLEVCGSSSPLSVSTLALSFSFLDPLASQSFSPCLPNRKNWSQPFPVLLFHSFNLNRSATSLGFSLSRSRLRYPYEHALPHPLEHLFPSFDRDGCGILSLHAFPSTIGIRDIKTFRDSSGDVDRDIECNEELDSFHDGEDGVLSHFSGSRVMMRGSNGLMDSLGPSPHGHDLCAMDCLACKAPRVDASQAKPFRPTSCSADWNSTRTPQITGTRFCRFIDSKASCSARLSLLGLFLRPPLLDPELLNLPSISLGSIGYSTELAELRHIPIKECSPTTRRLKWPLLVGLGALHGNFPPIYAAGVSSSSRSRRRDLVCRSRCIRRLFLSCLGPNLPNTLSLFSRHTPILGNRDEMDLPTSPSSIRTKRFGDDDSIVRLDANGEVNGIRRSPLGLSPSPICVGTPNPTPSTFNSRALAADEVSEFENLPVKRSLLLPSLSAPPASTTQSPYQSDLKAGRKGIVKSKHDLAISLLRQNQTARPLDCRPLVWWGAYVAGFDGMYQRESSVWLDTLCSYWRSSKSMAVKIIADPRLRRQSRSFYSRLVASVHAAWWMDLERQLVTDSSWRGSYLGSYLTKLHDEGHWMLENTKLFTIQPHLLDPGPGACTTPFHPPTWSFSSSFGRSGAPILRSLCGSKFDWRLSGEDETSFDSIAHPLPRTPVSAVLVSQDWQLVSIFCPFKDFRPRVPSFSLLLHLSRSPIQDSLFSVFSTLGPNQTSGLLIPQSLMWWGAQHGNFSVNVAGLVVELQTRFILHLSSPRIGLVSSTSSSSNSTLFLARAIWDPSSFIALAWSKEQCRPRSETVASKSRCLPINIRSDSYLVGSSRCEGMLVRRKITAVQLYSLCLTSIQSTGSDKAQSFGKSTSTLTPIFSLGFSEHSDTSLPKLQIQYQSRLSYTTEPRTLYLDRSKWPMETYEGSDWVWVRDSSDMPVVRKGHVMSGLWEFSADNFESSVPLYLPYHLFTAYLIPRRQLPLTFKPGQQTRVQAVQHSFGFPSPDLVSLPSSATVDSLTSLTRPSLCLPLRSTNWRSVANSNKYPSCLMSFVSIMSPQDLIPSPSRSLVEIFDKCLQSWVYIISSTTHTLTVKSPTPIYLPLSSEGRFWNICVTLPTKLLGSSMHCWEWGALLPTSHLLPQSELVKFLRLFCWGATRVGTTTRRDSRTFWRWQ